MRDCAAKLVCSWTYYLDVMDGGDSSWATIYFRYFMYFVLYVVLVTFDSTLRAEELITRRHARPCVARFLLLISSMDYLFPPLLHL